MSNSNNSNTSVPTDPNVPDNTSSDPSLDAIRRARTAGCPYMNAPDNYHNHHRNPPLFIDLDSFFGPTFPPFAPSAFFGPPFDPFRAHHPFMDSSFGPYSQCPYSHHGFGFHHPMHPFHRRHFSGPQRELFEDPFQSFDMDFRRAITAPTQDDAALAKIHTLGGDETELDAYNALQKSQSGERYLVGTMRSTQSRTGPDGKTHTRHVVRRRYSDGTEEVERSDSEEPGWEGMGRGLENSKVLKALEDGLGEHRGRLKEWVKEGESLWREAWEKGKEIVREIQNEGKGGNK